MLKTNVVIGNANQTLDIDMPITDLSVFLLLAISLDGLVGVVLVRELGQTLSTRREGVRLPQQHRRC